MGDVNGNFILLNSKNEIIFCQNIHHSELLYIFVLKSNIVATLSKAGDMRFWHLDNNNKMLTQITQELNISPKDQWVRAALQQNSQYGTSIFCLTNGKKESSLRKVSISFVRSGQIQINLARNNYSCTSGSTASHIIDVIDNQPLLFSEFHQTRYEKGGRGIEITGVTQANGSIIIDGGWDNYAPTRVYFKDSPKINAFMLPSCWVWIEWTNDKTSTRSNKIDKNKYQIEANLDQRQVYNKYFPNKTHFTLPWNCADKKAALFVQHLNDSNTFIIAQDKQIKIYRYQAQPKNSGQDPFILVDYKQTTSPIVGISQMTGGNLLITCREGVDTWYFNEKELLKIDDNTTTSTNFGLN